MDSPKEINNVFCLLQVHVLDTYILELAIPHLFVIGFIYCKKQWKQVLMFSKDIVCKKLSILKGITIHQYIIFAHWKAL